MVERLQCLYYWLSHDIGLSDFKITPISSDASFRRYFRVGWGSETRVVMDAPPAQEDCRPFIRVAHALDELGLNVPRVLRANVDKGFLLLTDLGTRQYLDELNKMTVAQLYGDALQALITLQTHSQSLQISSLPPYGYLLLMREMNLFRDWFVQAYLGITLNSQDAAALQRTFELLARSALEQPSVMVHRDFHSRNLLVTQQNNPGILDFQDAVKGPITYDLVSLLRDCYIAWPTERVIEWIKGFRRQAIGNGLEAGADDQQFLRWFDWMGMQRHFKAIGIFARLYLRDSKPGYLQDIPRTMGYLMEVSRHYPELGDVHRLLEGLVWPRWHEKNP